jgi:antitoxin component YwqK of YwqJK toxin-antitoxin module/S1-C subfamily serine protease
MSRLDELRRRDQKLAKRMGLERPEQEAGDAAPPRSRRKLFVSLLIVVVLGIVGAVLSALVLRRPGNADTSLAQVAERNAKAVGLVVATRLDGRTTIATAWAMEPDLYVTNAHVVVAVAKVLAAGGRAEIRVNRCPDLRFPVRETKIHPRYGDVRLGFDVGVLRIDGKAPATLSVASDAELRKLASGYRVAYLGFPSENLVGGNVKATDPIATMQSGIITSVSDFSLGDGGFENNQFIRHNLAVVGGASGSPVFNSAGDVVGVLNAGNMNVLVNEATRTASRAPSAAMVNFAQRVDLVAKVLKEGVSPSTRQAGRSPRTTVGTGHAKIDAVLASLEMDRPWVAMSASPQDEAAQQKWSTRELLSIRPPTVPAGAKEEAVENYPTGERKRTDVRDAQGVLLARRQYYVGGTLQRHTPLLAGREHGLEITFYGNGACCSRSEYVKGQRHGVEEQFHPQGWLSRRTVYREGAVMEPAFFYLPNGSPLDGEIKFFFTDMVKGRMTANVAKIVPVVDGRMHGSCTLFHPTGESRGQGTYERGWEHGNWTTCARDGTVLRTWSCRHGKRHGMLKAYYPSGKIRYEGEYADGKPVGDHRIYNGEGKVTVIACGRPATDSLTQSRP